MAPEVIKKKSEYSKSVDMWAIGIIMYEILTGGRHPLYDRSVDDKSTLTEKLMNCKEIKPDKCFSKLATSLFERRIHMHIGQRYKAKEAL